MNIPVSGQMLQTKPQKLHKDFILKIFSHAMDGLNRSGNDNINISFLSGEPGVDTEAAEDRKANLH